MMKLLRLAPLVLTMMTGAAEAEAGLQLPEIDYIRVEKAARTMPSFYEFFAGGGMARAGLGKGRMRQPLTS